MFILQQTVVSQNNSKTSAFKKTEPSLQFPNGQVNISASETIFDKVPESLRFGTSSIKSLLYGVGDAIANVSWSAGIGGAIGLAGGYFKTLASQKNLKGVAMFIPKQKNLFALAGVISLGLFSRNALLKSGDSVEASGVAGSEYAEFLNKLKKDVVTKAARGERFTENDIKIAETNSKALREKSANSLKDAFRSGAEGLTAIPIAATAGSLLGFFTAGATTPSVGSAVGGLVKFGVWGAVLAAVAAGAVWLYTRANPAESLAHTGGEAVRDIFTGAANGITGKTDPNTAIMPPRKTVDRTNDPEQRLPQVTESEQKNIDAARRLLQSGPPE
jgi:hypothetical protein